MNACYVPILRVKSQLSSLKKCYWAFITLQFAGLENIQTAICDVFPKLRPKRTLIALGLSILMFLLGLTMCTDVSKHHSKALWSDQVHTNGSIQYKKCFIWIIFSGGCVLDGTDELLFQWMVSRFDGSCWRHSFPMGVWYEHNQKLQSVFVETFSF